MPDSAPTLSVPCVKYLFTGNPTIYISSTILTQTYHYSVICSFEQMARTKGRDHDRPLFPCADGHLSHPCPLDMTYLHQTLPLAAATSWDQAYVVLDFPPIPALDGLSFISWWCIAAQPQHQLRKGCF